MTANVTSIWNWIYTNFLTDGGILVLLVCYAVGNYITRVNKTIDNTATVPILTVLGIVLVFIIPDLYAADPFSVRFIKGALLGWSSTGLHEFLKSIVNLGIIKIPGYEPNNKKDDDSGEIDM